MQIDIRQTGLEFTIFITKDQFQKIANLETNITGLLDKLVLDEAG